MGTKVQINGILDDISSGQALINTLARQTFEIAQKDVLESEVSVNKMKHLTSDIMKDVSKQDNARLMLQTAKQVEQ